VRLPPQDDGDVEPWTAPPSRRRQEAAIVGELPETLELVYANQIYIAKEGLHPGLRNRLLRIAAFQNPEFHKAQAMRLSTYGKPRVVACAEDHPHHIGMPRGCLDDMRQQLTSLTDAGGPRENLVEGRTGIVVRGSTAESWMHAVAALLEHAPYREGMGATARRYAESRTWAAALDPLFRTYRELGAGVSQAMGQEPAEMRALGRSPN